MAGLSVAVVVTGASIWPAGAVAGADQISGAKAQAQQLQGQIEQAAGRIRVLTLAYEQATAQSAALGQQVAADQAALARLQSTASSTASALRKDAITSYTGGMAATPSVGATASDAAVRAAYLDVATGALTDDIDTYRTQEARIATAAATLASEWRASRKAQAAADQARTSALAEAGSVQAQLVDIQGRIQRLESAQAAAQAAAAAQARAAATQGLPVNGGLVSVVRTVVSPPAGGSSGGVWLELRQCESGDNYQENSGNGFYGAYQFSQQTWAGLGYPGRPDQEPPAMQDQAAQKLQAESGWGQWPACSAALGLT
jgi:hypothetical protein